MKCTYCQEKIEIDYSGSFNRYKCEPCFAYFDVRHNEQKIFRSFIYFWLGSQQFILKLEHEENRCSSYQATGPDFLFKMQTVPNWTPSNVVEKVKRILPYI
jgi:hypothetical protein